MRKILTLRSASTASDTRRPPRCITLTDTIMATITVKQERSVGGRTWPREGVTRVPYWVYLDPDIYRIEQEKIFRGPTWNYVGLDAELPNPGDYKTTSIGDSPVIVTRD